MSRIYIKGCMPSKTLREADLAASDQVWTMNNQLGRNYDRKWDAPPTAHFSLHGLRYEVECHGARYLEYLSEMPWWVYFWKDQLALWEEVAAENGLAGLPRPKKAEAFPLDRIEAKLRRRYFTGSFAYLMAYAMLFVGVKEVHIVGTDFNSTDIRDARLKAARIIEFGREAPEFSLAYQSDRAKIIDNLRGQQAGDESWARECMMYWAGRLEQDGVHVVTDEDPWLFHNKWLDDHAKDCPHDSVRGLYGLDPCIGG